MFAVNMENNLNRFDHQEDIIGRKDGTKTATLVINLEVYHNQYNFSSNYTGYN